MGPAARTRVKICCISIVEEARLAIAYGASAVDLVSNMPSGPGVIAEEPIVEIAAAVPPGVASWLLTSHVNAGSYVGSSSASGRRSGAAIEPGISQNRTID